MRIDQLDDAPGASDVIHPDSPGNRSSSVVLVRSRRLLVTGVNRGLGRSLATEFVSRSHEVWGTIRSGDAPPGLAGCVHLDLRDEESIVVAANEIRSATEAIDVLVNCAGADARAFGAANASRGPFDFDAETFTAVLAANATGPMLTTREFLPLLRAGDGAMVVNISSQLGSMQVASRKGNDTAYCVSKAALNMLTVKTASALLDEQIGVVSLHPGWIATDMGGSSATFDLDDVTTIIADTIESLTVADTGRFVRWDGDDHPW